MLSQEVLTEFSKTNYKSTSQQTMRSLVSDLPEWEHRTEIEEERILSQRFFKRKVEEASESVPWGLGWFKPVALLSVLFFLGSTARVPRGVLRLRNVTMDERHFRKLVQELSQMFL